MHSDLMMVEETEIPPAEDANGLNPTARASKPSVVYLSAAQTRMATSTASRIPVCALVGFRNGRSTWSRGRIELGGSCGVWGIPPLSIIGPVMTQETK